MKVLLSVLVVLLTQTVAAEYTPKCPGASPDHNWQDLMNVTDWAAGAAFATFSKMAGYQFDVVKYNEDNPHPALFYYGRATATTCLPIDVLSGFMRTFSGLQIYYSQAVQAGGSDYEIQIKFRKKFQEMAELLGFDIYLIAEGEMV